MIPPARFFAALTILAVLPAAARADSRHMEATGASLAIETPCARTVTITPDPSLSGHVVLDAISTHPEEVAQLVFDSGNTAKLHTTDSECWQPEGTRSFRQTETIILRVPPGMAVAVEESGDAQYSVGAVGGALALSLSGTVSCKADRVTSAKIDLSGAGNVALGQLDGSLTAEISGTGTVQVDRGNLPQLGLSLSGVGGFILGSGQVGQLTLDVSGSGTVKIGAPVGDATLSVSGSGDVALARVTGRLTKDVDGSGTVTVGQN